MDKYVPYIEAEAAGRLSFKSIGELNEMEEKIFKVFSSVLFEIMDNTPREHSIYKMAQGNLRYIECEMQSFQEDILKKHYEQIVSLCSALENIFLDTSYDKNIN